MNAVDNYFLSLPLDTLTEILLKLSISNILRYCQTYVKVSHICSDEKFWWHYINIHWPREYLQKVLSFKLNDLPANNINTILFQRIGDPRNIESITNWPLAIAVFLDNSKLIQLVLLDSDDAEVLKKEILISKYDKLVTFLDAYPRDYYPLYLVTEENVHIFEFAEGDLAIFRRNNADPLPILKFHGEVYDSRQDYDVIQIKDIVVDDKPLFDVITELELNTDTWQG
jgi:hypothetical protein